MIQDSNELDVQNCLFDSEMELNLIIEQPDFDYIHKE